MLAAPQPSLDLVLSQPVRPVGGAQQLGLLDDPAPERVLQGEAGREKNDGPERSAGRPKGSVNRLTRDLVRVVVHKLGRHPLEEVARLYQADRDELVAVFGQGVKVAEIKERLLFKLVDATTPKMPVQVEVDKTETVTVVLGDLAGGVGGMMDVLDLPFNENNDLDSEEA